MESGTNSQQQIENMDSTLVQIEPGVSEIHTGSAMHSFDTMINEYIAQNPSGSIVHMQMAAAQQTDDHDDDNEQDELEVEISFSNSGDGVRGLGLINSGTNEISAFGPVRDTFIERVRNEAASRGFGNVRVVSITLLPHRMDGMEDVLHNSFENYMEGFRTADTLDPKILSQHDNAMQTFAAQLKGFQNQRKWRMKQFFKCVFGPRTSIQELNPLQFETVEMKKLIWTEFLNEIIKDFKQISRYKEEQLIKVERAQLSLIKAKLDTMKYQTSADDFVKGKLWRAILQIYLKESEHHCDGAKLPKLFLQEDSVCSICYSNAESEIPLCKLDWPTHNCNFTICTDCAGRSYFAISHGLREVAATRKVKDGLGVRIQCGLCREVFSAIHLRRYVNPPLQPLPPPPLPDWLCSRGGGGGGKRTVREQPKRKCKKIKSQ